MRRIERSIRFKHDYRRMLAAGDDNPIERDLATVLTLLAADLPLAARYRDHSLAGEWKGFRDCHVRPDIVLIYRKIGSDLLELARIGSHRELF